MFPYQLTEHDCIVPKKNSHVASLNWKFFSKYTITLFNDHGMNFTFSLEPTFLPFFHVFYLTKTDLNVLNNNKRDINNNYTHT